MGKGDPGGFLGRFRTAGRHIGEHDVTSDRYCIGMYPQWLHAHGIPTPIFPGGISLQPMIPGSGAPNTLPKQAAVTAALRFGLRFVPMLAVFSSWADIGITLFL
jgi:hypothetical protein